MKVVLARDFGGVYDEVCSPDASFGAPGTENQTYLHAKHLTELGCNVYVFGNMARDIEKDRVKFLGLDSFAKAKDFIRETVPDLIIAEGGAFFERTFGSKLEAELQDRLQNTYFLQVMHNLPIWNFHVKPNYIDYWCYVCESQKFFHKLQPSFDLFNSSFFESVYSKIPDTEKKMQIVTVGSPSKPGTIDAITTIRKLQKDYDLKAVFLMPRWFSSSKQFMELQSKYPEVRFDNLNITDMSKLLKESMAVISSFHFGEQCPVTILDSYVAGTLCITGEKGSLRYLNPAGIRCSRKDLSDVIKWIIHNPEKCTELGQRGLAYLKQSSHIESSQKAQLKYILEYLQKHKKPGCLQKQYNKVFFWFDKKLRTSTARRIFSDLGFSIQHRSWRQDVY